MYKLSKITREQAEVTRFKAYSMNITLDLPKSLFINKLLDIQQSFL